MRNSKHGFPEHLMKRTYTKRAETSISNLRTQASFQEGGMDDKGLARCSGCRNTAEIDSHLTNMSFYHCGTGMQGPPQSPSSCPCYFSNKLSFGKDVVFTS